MATSIPPPIGDLEIPIDRWTAPFWEAAAERRLVLPCCAACGTFRWPPGPFCPSCRSQELSWVDAGAASIFSYTVVAVQAGEEGGPFTIPVLIEFAKAPGVRLLTALVDAEPSAVSIGAPVELVWTSAADATVPHVRLA